MLVISRKKNEGMIINENTELTIIDIQGDRVKIGIEAPSEVKIIRKELLETEDANREAALTKIRPDLKKLKELENILKKQKI